MENIVDHEVEIRALVDDLAQIKEKIISSQGQFKSKVSIKDIYFCPESATTFEEISMKEIGSFGLRLREIKSGDSVTNELNVKVITRHEDHQAWKECEVKVGSFENMRNILLKTGFKELVLIEKDRETYILDGIEFHLEDIKDFGKGVEAEIMTTHEHAPSAKERIINWFKKLGIPRESILPKSITLLIMKERAFK